jgi:hypothetical protein
MHYDEAIITAYRAIQPRVPGIFVLRLWERIFVATRVTHEGRTFILRVAEAFPDSGEWAIVPQTAAQLEKQTREFVENR